MIPDFLKIHSAERTYKENSSSSIFFSRHQKVYTFVLNFLKNKSVLEVGCGSGYGTNRIARVAKNVIALDKDKTAIIQNRKSSHLSNISFVHTSIEDFIPEAPVDCIVAFQLIEHIKHPQIFVEKIAMSLKKNGLSIISTPNGPTQSYNENPYHYKELNSYELKKLLYEYFESITVYGLYGDKLINEFEDKKRKTVRLVFKKDPFKIRRIIPRKIRQLLFNIVSQMSSNHIVDIKLKNISEKNYRISKRDIEKSLDLIAVCKNPK